MSNSQEDVEWLCASFAQFNLALVEYARLHGLTTNYLTHNPLDSDLVPPLPASWQADLEDPEGPVNIGLPVCLDALNGYTDHERLDIDRDSADLLASAIKLGQDDDFLDGWVDEQANRFKYLKVEEPILRSDPELDLICLRRRNTPTVSADGMQPFADREIQDLPFISSERDAVMLELLKESVDEKLDIDRSTVVYLGEICKELEDDGDYDVETLLSHRKTRFPSPETPPLLSSSPSLKAAELHIEGMDMELTSSPEDLIRREAAELEKRILDEDGSLYAKEANNRGQHDVDLSIYDIPQSPTLSSSSSMPRKRVKDLKVEVPLTPENSLEPPAKKLKTVSFSEELQTLIPPLSSEIAMSETDANNSESEIFRRDVLECAAKDALKQVEDEQLDEFDTTLRVPVPPVHDYAVDIPWEKSSNQIVECICELEKQLVLPEQNELDEGEKRWSGVQRIERQLPWTPFPQGLGRVDNEEEIDDGFLARYLAELTTDDDLDIESLLCTTATPKLFEDDEDEEGLVVEYEESVDSDDETQTKHHSEVNYSSLVAKTPATCHASAIDNLDPMSDGRMDMQTLLKKRKMELDTAERESHARATVSNTSNNADLVRKTDHTATAKPTRFSDLSHTVGDLANFLHLHGGPSPTHLQQIQHIPPVPVMISAKQNQAAAVKERCMTISAPTISNIEGALFIIISPMVMADRDLMRELRKSLPTLDVVTRDMLPSKRKETMQDVRTEADITTSPSTGIISTTLQRLKQMPLPGQSSFVSVRDRIAAVSCKYDHLIVLVSEGSRQDDKDTALIGPLDDKDVQTISDLIGFATSLEHDVEVHFVPGREPQLATWLAARISRTVALNVSITLMQEESAWERLLRQAGLNPFAAQFVLFNLKPKEILNSMETSSLSSRSAMGAFGPAAFVQMTVSQRIEMFGHAIGEKVIERVSDVLDRGFIPGGQQGKMH